MKRRRTANRAIKQLRDFVWRSRGERQLLAQAAWLVLMIRLGLSLLPFKTVLRLAERARRRTARRANTIPAERLAWAVQRVSRYLPAATCLTQGLATHVLLARHGLEGALRIGVAKGDDGRLEAHAWIERNGVVLIGALPDLGRYVQLPSLELADR